MKNPDFNTCPLKIISTVLFILILFSSKAQTNTSLSFDGIDDQVNISNAGVFDFTTGTVEAWVKPGSFNADKVFIAMRSAGGNRWSAYLNQSAGTIGITNNSSSNSLAYSFQPAVWYHIALVMSASNTAVYVNGLFVGNTGNGITTSVTGNSLIIGSPNDAAFSANWFAGNIDAVRIWNIALTQAQIKETLFKEPAANAGGLLANYNFNEGSGAALINSSTNSIGVDGSLVNGPVWANSPVTFATNALNFDGSDDFIVIPNMVSSDFTIEYLIKTTVAGSGNASSQWYNGNGIVDAEVGGVTNDFGTAITGTRLGFGVGNPDITIHSVSDVNTGNWVHVAASWKQSTGEMKLYINGVLEASATSGTALRTAPPRIAIGELQTNIQRFNGSMDEVRIWNEVRSSAQIQANMNNEINPSAETTLLAYYTFNQGIDAGTNTGLITIPDQKGNNNGLLTNFSLSGTGSNYIAQNSSLIVLPLQWLGFTAQKQGSNILLHWSTASEQNSKDFTVQRSIDGIVWNSLGKVAAAGNSNTIRNYSYVDAAPVAGINYYRIQQIDIDGRSSYSDLRNIKFSGTNIPFTILENPISNGILQVQVNVAAALSLYSTNGALLWTKKCIPGIQLINISGYTKGIYLLKSNDLVQKIVLQ